MDDLPWTPDLEAQHGFAAHEFPRNKSKALAMALPTASEVPFGKALQELQRSTGILPDSPTGSPPPSASES